MSGFPSFRIGCVPYFNAYPLCAYPQDPTIRFVVPSRLSEEFHKGLYDAALIPVFEWFRGSQLLAVEGVAIACQGAVRSVLIAHKEPFGELHDIWLDPASRTSIHLAQILFRRHFRKEVTWHEGKVPPDGARVVIGDPALRIYLGEGGWQMIDLGSAWWDFTGLPFVFALWALAPTLRSPEKIAVTLRRWKTEGLAKRHLIAKEQTSFPEAVLLDYLTRAIRYDLGNSQKEAIERFQQLLYEEGFLEEKRPLKFI